MERPKTRSILIVQVREGDLDSSFDKRIGEKDEFKICFGCRIDRTHDITVRKRGNKSTYKYTCQKYIVG